MTAAADTRLGLSVSRKLAEKRRMRARDAMDTGYHGHGIPREANVQ
jgi:hypothetical protein